MAKKETASPAIPVFPMLKTVEQMSKVSGIGENKLRELMCCFYMWGCSYMLCVQNGSYCFSVGSLVKRKEPPQIEEALRFC